jgi:hypothetical protein
VFINLHTISLLLITLTALDIIFPVNMRTFAPLIPNFDLDITHICQDMDDSYGADAGWLERCSASFAAVKLGAAWACLILTAAQWWFLCAVRSLRKALQDRQCRRLDVEVAQAP